MAKPSTTTSARTRSAKPIELVLSNGIPVILQPTEGAVAATYWWVKTGSSDENPPEAGFAHFLEHMLFKDAAAKDTGKASTGQMARAIESLGGDINAYTSFDQTVFHVTCAGHHWERVLDAFGTIAKPQRFLKSDFEREREVILEELKKNEDSPGRQLFQGLFSATYKKHPYGRPVIGFVKTLKAATVTQLEAFYRRNYVSGNMGLVLVGPTDEKRQKGIVKLLEKHFGAKVISKKAAPEKKRPLEPAHRDGVLMVKKTFDVKTPTLAFSFRAPELKHEDIPALDLACSVLAMGELSRLYQRLFYGSSIVTDVSGGLYVPSDPGMLYFQAESDSVDKLPRIAQEMFEELDRFLKEGPTEEELKRVLVNSESDRFYSTQTADGMAGRLGFLNYILGDLDFDRDYLEVLRSIDKDKIREVLSRYLDVRRMSCVLLLPKEHAEFNLAPIEAAAKKIFTSKEVAVLPVLAKAKTAAKTSKSGVPEFFTTPSGVRVIYRENPQSHVMSIHAATFGGLRLERGAPIETAEKDWGASYLMSLTWTKGTSRRNAREIAALVEGSAASIDGFSGRNTIGAQVTGLARDWKKLSSLYSEILLDPTFDEKELEHSKRVAEDSIRGLEDHSSQLCSKLFLETLYENHPYGHLTIGSLESIAAMKSEKLKAFHKAWIRPDRMVFSVVGAVKRPDLERWLADTDEQMLKFASKNTAVTKIAEEPTLKAPRWVEKNLGREQLHILVGGLGSTLDSEERYAIRLMQTLLGGQSGRLFIELREKKSLAYTVSPVSFEGMERGYIGTYIACSPSKREEALRGIQEVLERLASKGPTPAEMKRAQEFFLGRKSMDLQSDSALATHYGLEAVYGLPFLDDQQFIKKVRGISAKEIQRVCRKFLVEPHMVTSVVG